MSDTNCRKKGNKSDILRFLIKKNSPDPDQIYHEQEADSETDIRPRTPDPHHHGNKDLRRQDGWIRDDAGALPNSYTNYPCFPQ